MAEPAHGAGVHQVQVLARLRLSQGVRRGPVREREIVQDRWGSGGSLPEPAPCSTLDHADDGDNGIGVPLAVAAGAPAISSEARGASSPHASRSSRNAGPCEERMTKRSTAGPRAFVLA